MGSKELLVEAQKGLKLRDIALFQASFVRPTPDSGDKPGEIFQEGKRAVTFVIGAGANTKTRLLQIKVELGTRVVREPETPSPEVLFVIEADYIVEYELLDHLSDDAIKAFVENNAVHNVWPFWRQHVFDVVQRARLPHLEIPLYAGSAS